MSMEDQPKTTPGPSGPKSFVYTEIAKTTPDLSVPKSFVGGEIAKTTSSLSGPKSISGDATGAQLTSIGEARWWGEGEGWV